MPEECRSQSRCREAKSLQRKRSQYHGWTGLCVLQLNGENSLNQFEMDMVVEASNVINERSFISSAKCRQSSEMICPAISDKLLAGSVVTATSVRSNIIRKFVSEGKLPAFLIGDNLVKFDAKDLDHFSPRVGSTFIADPIDTERRVGHYGLGSPGAVGAICGSDAGCVGKGGGIGCGGSVSPGCGAGSPAGGIPSVGRTGLLQKPAGPI